MADNCLDASGSVTAPSLTFGAAAVSLPCGINISIPIPSIGDILANIALNLPTLTLKFALPFKFELSCDLSNPIDITADIPFGGGRVACFNASPDDHDD